MTAQSKPTVVEALASVMEDVRAVRKADRNTQQNYQFRGIDAVMNAVGPALRAHNVVVMPMCEQANYRDVATSTGKPSRECTVIVRYRFYGPAGDYIECVTPGESMDFGDKGAPKAMSVAYRIALLQALCLPTDEPDPDAASYERAQETPPTNAELVAQARSRVAAACTENGWDRDVVAALYAEKAGHDISAATDPVRVSKFRDYLYSLPQAELMPPAAATNGATA